jgi:hypothetical protein
LRCAESGAVASTRLHSRAAREQDQDRDDIIDKMNSSWVPWLFRLFLAKSAKKQNTEYLIKTIMKRIDDIMNFNLGVTPLII